MAQVVRSLPLMWETQMEFPASCFNLAQLQPLQAFGSELVDGNSLCLSVSLSQTHFKNCLNWGQHYGIVCTAATYDASIPVHVLAALLLIQFPSNGLGKTWKRVKVSGYLPSTWQTQMEFLAPGFGLAHPRP